jgi:hypothetical protein
MILKQAGDNKDLPAMAVIKLFGNITSRDVTDSLDHMLQNRLLDKILFYASKDKQIEGQRPISCEICWLISNITAGTVV